MESGSIEREIRIDAAPEIVFAVVSDPAHVQQWWADEARYEAVPGSAGQIVLTGPGGRKVPVAFQVVDAVPHRLFSFRWTHPEGEQPREANSFLVTFSLEPVGDGTLLRVTETGFRERGWEAAVIEKAYRDHCEGWDHHLPRLAPYLATYAADAR
jgi:uncharacterized protein YndB with AHSA1/START domain